MRFEAPIPGANLVADTRKYPWHRPPDLTQYDEAVDYMLERMSQEEQAEIIYSLLQLKTPIVAIVSGMLMQAIAKGKFQIDLAILIAGPLARYIEILAKDEGFPHEMGIENPNRIRITPTVLKAALGIVEDDDDDPEETSPQTPMPSGGLMGAPTSDGPASEDEQAAMLGMMEEEPIEEEQENEPLA